MQTIQAVLFDLDNTILDRTKTFGKFTDLFLRMYMNHVGSTQNLFDLIVERDRDGYKDKTELFSELLEQLPWKNKPSLDELLDFYRKEYVRCAVLMDRAKEVIDHVRSKYRIGLITNGKTSIQYGKIDQLGIRGDFDVILVSEEAGVKKPDPGIFRMALDKLELLPEQCVFVGDHPINDVEGAARAGMAAIWLKVNQPWPDGVQAAPLHTIDRLSDLLELL